MLQQLADHIGKLCWQWWSGDIILGDGFFHFPFVGIGFLEQPFFNVGRKFFRIFQTFLLQRRGNFNGFGQW